MKTGRNTLDNEAGFENPDRRRARLAPAALLAVALVVSAAYAQNRSLMSNTWNGTQPSGHSDSQLGPDTAHAAALRAHDSQRPHGSGPAR